MAKKPYNPILGETFHCYWDLPDARRTPPDENAKVTACTHFMTQHMLLLSLSLSSLSSSPHEQKLLESGPVPYASYDSVTFVAEQVSHHPPSMFLCQNTNPDALSLSSLLPSQYLVSTQSAFPNACV